MSKHENCMRVKWFTLHHRHIDRLLEDSPFAIRVVANGLPQGAEYVQTTWDWQRRALMVLYRHDSFELIPEGAEIPVHIDTEWELVRINKEGNVVNV